MEAQNKWFRRIVAIALITALVIGAVNAVVFSSWRDNVIIEQGKTIARQGEIIAEQDKTIEVLTTGACYGYLANVRIDYAMIGVRSNTSDIVLGSKQYANCIALLEKLTAVRAETGE